jgi:NAD(P)-dependent dehydrogenase (short-subunit alcohol dehydrogenase family)
MKQSIDSEIAASSAVGRGVADGLAIPNTVNMMDTGSIRRFVDEITSRHGKLKKQVILFNNAGVCIEGNSHAALENSLLVNCLGPAHLTELTINSVKNSPLERNANDRSLTVINVSSGEGELLFLNSHVQDELRSIKTYEVRVSYQSSVISLSHRASYSYNVSVLRCAQQFKYCVTWTEQQGWRAYIDGLLRLSRSRESGGGGRPSADSDFEYAFGPTPFYSLSKALLNVYTRIAHERLSAAAGSGSGLGLRSRVISVCPGNFHSPMSRPEEAEDAIHVDEAAAHLLEVALGDPERFPGGKFYRFGEEIPW